MNKVDIEYMLRQYRCTPSLWIRRSVLSRFRQTFGTETSRSLWKRSVPLYLVAAETILVVGLSFFAGKRMAERERQSLLWSEPEPKVEGIEEIAPTIAVSDLL